MGIKHLSSSERFKRSENNYITEYIASLKEQMKPLKGEMLFLREELREKNLRTKQKYKASTVDRTELHNIDKDNKNDKNDNNSNKYIGENLHNNLVSNDKNHVNISDINCNSIFCSSNNNSNHNTLNADFVYDNENKYNNNHKSYDNSADNYNSNNENNCNNDNNNKKII